MKLIQRITVSSGGAASITFASIPATFTDLVLVTSLRTNRTGSTEDSVKVEFNGITTGYTRRSLRGDGQFNSSVTGTDSLILLNQNTNSTTSNTFSNASLYIPNYSGSAAKSVSADTANENNATEAWLNIVAALWNNSAAINSIQLAPNVGPVFAEHSSATLYGILKGSDGTTTVT
jgi:hypothetical protein